MNVKPITTKELLETVEYAHGCFEALRMKAKDFKKQDEHERRKLCLLQVKKILKMVRDFGGLEAIEEQLRTAIQNNQPSLFDLSDSAEPRTLEDLSFNKIKKS